MEGQDSFIMRQPEDVEAEFGEDDEDVVADAGNNADLYAANQGSTELINEAPTEEAPLRFMDQDVIHHQPLSLDFSCNSLRFCVRKNRWNESQLLLSCNLSVLSHFLIKPNLKRSLHCLITGPRLTVHAC